MDKARELIAKGEPEALLYRVIVKPIEATTEMEKVEMEKFKELAKSGFQVKTDKQASRETVGAMFGVLVHLSDGAFKDKGERVVGSLPEEGDVVIFDRYAGKDIEIPPGSGNTYKFCNDESILGRMVNVG